MFLIIIVECFFNNLNNSLSLNRVNAKCVLKFLEHFVEMNKKDLFVIFKFLYQHVRKLIWIYFCVSSIDVNVICNNIACLLDSLKYKTLNVCCFKTNHFFFEVQRSNCKIIL